MATLPLLSRFTLAHLRSHHVSNDGNAQAISQPSIEGEQPRTSTATSLLPVPTKTTDTLTRQHESASQLVTLPLLSGFTFAHLGSYHVSNDGNAQAISQPSNGGERPKTSTVTLPPLMSTESSQTPATPIWRPLACIDGLDDGLTAEKKIMMRELMGSGFTFNVLELAGGPLTKTTLTVPAYSRQTLRDALFKFDPEWTSGNYWLNFKGRVITASHAIWDMPVVQLLFKYDFKPSSDFVTVIKDHTPLLATPVMPPEVNYTPRPPENPADTPLQFSHRGRFVTG